MTWSGLFDLSNGSTSVLAREERSDDWSIEGARGELRMVAWLTKALHAFDLTTEGLWGLVSFLGVSIGSIAAAAFLRSSGQPPIFVTLGAVADTPSNGAERHEPAATAVWEATHGVERGVAGPIRPHPSARAMKRTPSRPKGAGHCKARGRR